MRRREFFEMIKVLGPVVSRCFSVGGRGVVEQISIGRMCCRSLAMGRDVLYAMDHAYDHTLCLFEQFEFKGNSWCTLPS